MKFDFIEIGTSNFNTCIQSCSDSEVGLSIEPLQNYLDDLPNKPNVTKVNWAISDKNTTIPLFYISKENIDKYLINCNDLKGCNRLGEPHPYVKNILQNLNLNHLMEKKDIEVKTFKDIIDTFDVTEIDYLKIDTEGHDAIILHGMCDFFEDPSGVEGTLSRQRKIALYPKKIHFESNFLTTDNDYQKLITRLSAHNYIIVERTNTDTTMIHLDKKLKPSKVYKSLKIYKILINAYDLTDITKWECARHISKFIRFIQEKSGLFKVNSDSFVYFAIRSVNTILTINDTKCFSHVNETPDLIIGQQYAIGNAFKISQEIGCKFAPIMYYNIYECELSFKYSYIFTWNNKLQTEIRKLAPGMYQNILSLNEMLTNLNTILQHIFDV